MNDSAVQGFRALAHDIRLSVFRLLIRAGANGMPAGGIATELAIPASTLSSHLSQLEQAGLIYSWREQQKIVYAVNMEGTQTLIRFLMEDCCSGKPELCGYNLKTGRNTSSKKRTTA